MSSWAKPGVKCVCIGAFKPREGAPPVSFPEVGKTYTIRDVRPARKRPGEVQIRLVELVNPANYRGPGGMTEPTFWLAKFRPLVPPKTQADDVALFAPLLTAKQPEMVS